MPMTAASPAAGEMVVSSTTNHLPAAGHDDDGDEDIAGIREQHNDEVIEYAAAASSSSSGQHHRMCQQHLCRQDSPPDIDSTTSDHPLRDNVPVSFASSSSSSIASPPANLPNDQPVPQQEHHVPGMSFTGTQSQSLVPFYNQPHDPVGGNESLSSDQIYHLDQNNSQCGSSNQLYLSNHHHHHVYPHLSHPQSNCHLQHPSPQHIFRMLHHMDSQADTSAGTMGIHETGHLPLHPDPEAAHHSVWQPQLSASSQPVVPFSSSSEELQLHEHYSELQQVMSRSSRSHSMEEEVSEQLIDHRNPHHHHHSSHQYMLPAQNSVGEEAAVPPHDQHLHVAAGAPGMSQQLDDEEEDEQEIVISDVPVESRARASLPSAYLFIDLVIEDDVVGFNRDLMQSVTYGVYARKTIPERTQFGPVEGVISQIGSSQYKNNVYNQHSLQNLIVFISESLILDQSDENKSNWMRFVRAADSPATQNLILVTKEQIQANPDNSEELITTTKFYFMTTKCINPREELRVWYSKDYADRFRLKLLHESEDLDVDPADAQSPPAAADLRFNPNTNSAFFRSSSSAPPSISASDPLNLHNLHVQIPLQMHSSSSHSIHEPHPHPMAIQSTDASFGHDSEARLPHGTDLDHSLPLILNVVVSQSSASSQESAARSSPHPIASDTTNNMAISEAKSLSPIPPLPPVCEQVTISAQPDPHLPPASGHKLRNKIAKTQHQQQLQLQQQQKQVNPEIADKSDQEVILPSKSSNNNKPAFQHKCDTCGKTFPRCYSLRRHQIMHSGEKKYKCPICSMSFSHVYNRNRHVKRHANRSNGLMRRAAVTPREGQGDRPDEDCDVALGEGASDSLTDSVTSSDVSDKKENESQNRPAHDSGTKSLTSSSPSAAAAKSFKCSQCYKSFSSDERLSKHALVHSGDDLKKPLECNICLKRFLNNSALACHLKVHSVSRDQPKMYDCVLCKKEFECTQSRKEHVSTHADPVTGQYSCTHCKKKFDEFASVRKHIRAFHSDKQYPCPICQKVFPRPDKLKLHMLRHSDHREFLCQSCGKQFKRKDKLKEHMQRMHAPDREARLAAKKAANAQAALRTAANLQSLNHSSDSNCSSSFGTGSAKKGSAPKASAGDYDKFIYKCHTCILGFKRRGMLVNHLAKRHPELPPDAVPELNLPILKTTRDYYCQYCDKIYKSSSKRKAHILKNHPGKSLPLSNRHKGGVPTIPGIPNPTYSAPVGSITTHPHYCDWCHKQYASKAKLLQHQRKKHPDRLMTEKSSIIKENSSICGNISDVVGHGSADHLISTNSHPVTSQTHNYEVMGTSSGAHGVTAGDSNSAAVLNSSNSNLITILGNLGLSSFSSIISNQMRGSADGPAAGGEVSDLHELLHSHSSENDLLTQAMSELTGSQNPRPDSEGQLVHESMKHDEVTTDRQPQPLDVNEAELWT